MVFMCQQDSFLTEFEAKVISCEEASTAITIDGKKTPVNGYEVILEDTILFPEGGGQSCDVGFLDSVNVVQVTRRGAEAVHFVTSPLVVGNTVKQTINWDRRLDHMQQHSGQHLLSAILERDYGFSSTSWWLGDDISYVELDTKLITQEQIDKTELIINGYIRDGIAVKVETFDVTEAGTDSQSRFFVKKLPADHEGPVRLINIEGIDRNLCCGTHVSNLSQLQCIKLLSVEKGKQGRQNLNFIVGNRVLKQLQKCLDREQSLTALLKGGPSTHTDLVSKLQISQKAAAKNVQNLCKYVASLEAKKILSQNPLPKYVCLHRTEGVDTDFISVLIKEIGTTDILLFVTVGNENGSGNMVLYGQEEIVQALGPKICELLGGKGAGKSTRFQAKVTNMKNRQLCEQLIEEQLNIKIQP